MNSILKEDLEEIASSELIDWKQLENKTLFITGSTGLIGTILVQSILMRNEKYNTNISLILIVRNEEKAKEKFGTKNITYIESDIIKYNIKDLKIDYIIHAASPTKSKFFVEEPVETLDIAIIGTKKMLEQAKKSNVQSMVYLSSMEMYGVIDSENLTEDMLGYINPLNVRSSYSEGKRICELYSYSYYSKYNVPAKIARIAQTFGAGVSENETRVYKTFVDSILEKKDIIIKTTGTTNINYCYTTDTIIGILYILLNGKNGEAYNLVGEKTNMTIAQSAEWLAEQYGEDKVKVKYEISDDRKQFAPDNTLILSNEKLKLLGWSPKYNLKQGYEKLIKYLQEERGKKQNEKN